MWQRIMVAVLRRIKGQFLQCFESPALVQLYPLLASLEICRYLHLVRFCSPPAQAKSGHSSPFMAWPSCDSLQQHMRLAAYELLFLRFSGAGKRVHDLSAKAWTRTRLLLVLLTLLLLLLDILVCLLFRKDLPMAHAYHLAEGIVVRKFSILHFPQSKSLRVTGGHAMERGQGMLNGLVGIAVGVLQEIDGQN